MANPFRIKGFSTLRLSVVDVAKSCAWYARFLGIEASYVDPDFASFNVAGVQLDLCTADGRSPVSAGGSVGYWLVEDLDIAVARAKELGAAVYRGPLRVEEVRRSIVQVADPYGNVFGLEAEF